ncbi:hypothetical protein VNO77_02552 [Canavalia gladiata]|uniref:Uncharacterized protein n=1 Tax=Canavalia gladiata TaxID=3824 RepID=A0AAN9MYG1_CANGL
MENKNIMLTLLIFLILQHNFGSVAASRKNIYPPPTIPRTFLRSPQPPSPVLYTTNDDKINDGDAFRPTSPGHSPGVGHNAPPNKA